MSLFVGIDSGARGGIAAVGDHYQYAGPMPATEDGVVSRLRELTDLGITALALERAQAMPGQGVCSMFNYGQQYGFLRGVLAALNVPTVLVGPRQWQKVMYAGLPPELEGKERSIVAARRLSGIDLVLPRCRKPHDGMADAILLAHYMRSTYVRC